MIVEIKNNFKIITPNNNMWLCNKKHKVIGQKVSMSVTSDEAEWQEITKDEKIRLETLWNTEIPTEIEATEAELKAQAYDILMGVNE